MANRIKGDTPVTLKDGRTVTLLFDFDAMCEVEDLLDRPFAELLEEISPKFEVPGDPSSRLVREGRAPRLKEARALVAAGLKRHHPEIALSEAGNLLLSDGEALFANITTAIESAFGDPDPDGAEAGEDAGAHPPKPKPISGTGTKP